MKFQDLVGHRLLALREENETLLIETDKGKYRCTAEGDCCARAFVSSVVNAADILGHEITAVEIKDAPDGYTDPTDPTTDEARDIDFYTFVTAVGRADVILHTDHNGYYGGWLNAPEYIR